MTSLEQRKSPHEHAFYHPGTVPARASIGTMIIEEQTGYRLKSGESLLETIGNDQVMHSSHENSGLNSVF